MKKFAYFKVVLATSLVWVFLDIFLLLYFSECNKCEDKERGLPAGDGEFTQFCFIVTCSIFLIISVDVLCQWFEVCFFFYVAVTLAMH